MNKLKRILTIFICLIPAFTFVASPSAYSDGSVNSGQLSESQVLGIIKEALVDHVTYAESIYHASSSVPDAGYFGTGASDEHGVRTNADYALMYAFLYSRFSDLTFSGIPRLTIRDKAIASFKYAFKTHVTGTFNCTDGVKWGNKWQSSLWTQALGMSAWLIWNDLAEATKNGITAMIVSEADYINARNPRIQEWDNTAAEENGWDSNIVALARSMFPTHTRASAWDTKAKSFAMNTFSMLQDESDAAVIDGKTVANWVLGVNIHPDYTLENHNIFHPVYQMVPIQELTESAVFYAKAGLAVPGSLKHHVMDVWDEVLKKILTADGEWAYPNGIDWSIYDYEHLETYSALATLYQDVDAKFLESRLVQYMRARQLTTPNKAFLLNPDVGERRMGVLAHRLVYAYLMHDYFGPVPSSSTTWNNIEASQFETKIFPYAKVIRGMNSYRMTAFSWQNYTMGVILPKSEGYLDNPYTTFPLKTGNTGNLTGSFNITGKAQNATLQAFTCAVKNDSYVTSGHIVENDSSLDHYISFFQIPGNAVIYMDKVKAKTSITVTKEAGLSLGIVTDTICGNTRTIYYEEGNQNVSGSTLISVPGTWVNIDGKIGMIRLSSQGIRFGEQALTNSIEVSKLYGSFNNTSRSFSSGSVVTSRTAAFYSNVSSAITDVLADEVQYPMLADGWKPAVVKDPDNRRFLAVANQYGADTTSITVSCTEGAPVLKKDVIVTGSSGSSTLEGLQGTAQLHELGTYVTASAGSLTAIQGSTPYKAYIRNPGDSSISAIVKIWNNGSFLTGMQTIAAGETYLVQLSGENVTFSIATYPSAPVNYALTGTMTATSSQPLYPPTYANDDNTSTFWVSDDAPQDSEQYLTCDLGSIYNISKVKIRSRANYGPKDVVVELSTNGGAYIVVANATLKNAEGPHDILLIDEVPARYVRLKITSSYDVKSPSRNVQIKELGVYGR